MHPDLFVAFVVATMTSALESVGEYYTIAPVSRERTPRSHAINRGILAEVSSTFQKKEIENEKHAKTQRNDKNANAKICVQLSAL